jgi:hypothetical protein
MLCVCDSIADRLWFAIPQVAEWQHIEKYTDAAMMFARLDVIFTRGMHSGYLERHPTVCWGAIEPFEGRVPSETPVRTQAIARARRDLGRASHSLCSS